MRTLLRPFSVLAFLCASSLPAAAQCQQWASGFHLDGIDGPVIALERADLGSGPEIYAGGIFTRVGEKAINNIARWDGAQWQPLGAGVNGVNGAVNTITTFDDGTGVQLYIGGAFTQAGGVTTGNLAKWNGTTWSAVAATGPNNAVNDLQVYDAGTGPKLYVCGSFGLVTGIQNARRVACWDGTVWTALGYGTNATANDLAVFDDGTGPQLYVGGTFTNLGNNSPGDTAGFYIGRWNGTVWNGTFGGMNNHVHSLEVLDDGTGPALYVGGGFTLAGGQAAERAAKYTGAGWSAIGFGLNSPVEDFEIYDDGAGPALYATGAFSNAGRLARFYPGLNWIAVGGGISSGGGSLVAHPFGGVPALWTGGNQNTGGNVSTHGVIVWDGTQYSAVLPGDGIDVQSVDPVVHDDGSGPALYVPGNFWRGAGSERIDSAATARWNGTSWSQVGQPSVLGADMASAPPGPVAGLYAVSYGNTATLPTGIARWDGTTWNAITTGVPVPRFTAITYFDDGVSPGIYIGGDFVGVGALQAPHIVKWDGTTWVNVGSLPLTEPMSLVEHDDGSGRTLYALGRDPQVYKYVGGAWVAYTNLVNGSAAEMISYDDGSGPALWVRGNLTASGMQNQRLAKIVGGLFTAVPGAATLELDDFCVFDDGSGPAIHALSYFPTFPGNASQVFRLGATGWSPSTTRVDALARSMQVFDDGSGGGPDLFLLGDFKNADGRASHGIARWEGCGGTGTNFCFGDGSATPCPCGNASPAGEQRGCLNSLGLGGRLVASGTASLANDTVVLDGSAMANSSVLYFQGTAPANGGLGSVFGDGLRCAGGSVVRLATLVNAAGASQYPGVGNPSVSVRGQVLAPGLRTYQAWYRNAAAFCTSGTFNLTNGSSVTWLP